MFFDEYESLNRKKCATDIYLDYSGGSFVDFTCATDIIKRRTHKNFPTKNELSDSPKFSQTRNGLFFSSPYKISFNFSCLGEKFYRQSESDVGRIEFSEFCSLRIGNTTFRGRHSISEYIFSEDTLGAGDVSEFLVPINNSTLKIPYKPTSFPKNRSILHPHLSLEQWNRLKQNIEIVAATGSIAILIMVILTLCACRLMNKWDREARTNAFISYAGYTRGETAV